MKKISTLVYLIISAIIFLNSSGYSQDRCPYLGPQQPANYYSTTVNNFTITDTEGNFHDLYETLDSGMTVFIDLFFTRCSYCQQYAGIIEQVYQNTGAGSENILMWGISNDPYDTNPVIDQYRENYDITNPCAGPQGGGTTAHTTIISGQNFLGWPTYCVICPDYTMFFDPVYPPTVTGFDPYFSQCQDLAGIGEPYPQKASAIESLFPNPVEDVLYVSLYSDRSALSTLELFDLTGSRLIQKESRSSAGRQELMMDMSTLAPGYYFLKFSQDGIFKGVRRVIVR